MKIAKKWTKRVLKDLWLSFAIIRIIGANEASAAPEPSGWFAGDMHVHRSCGGAPVPISQIYNAMVQKDLAVVSLLADSGNGEVLDPGTDLPKVNGQNDPVSTSGRIVHWDAEWHWDATYTQFPHQVLGGHIVSLGLPEAQQLVEEYTYPVFQWAKTRGAISGFAHMQYLGNTFPQQLDCCQPLEYPIEVALGGADFISQDVQGGDSFLTAYYRLLNCGFRPGFAAGSDYPCNAQIGQLLTYVQVSGGLTYRKWIEGIAKGRTVVSRNSKKEFLRLTVDGSLTPGDELKIATGRNVPVSIQWPVAQSLSGRIELVHNGNVVASKQTSASVLFPGSLTAQVNFTKSGWLCARLMDSNGHRVHTAAVFVTVNNAPVRASSSDAQFYIDWIDQLIARTSQGGVWASFFQEDREAAHARYLAARAVYQQIAQEAGGGVSAFAINNTALPHAVANQSYTAFLTATGGVTPLTWSVSGGALPQGLALNSTNGSITGTATGNGISALTIQVKDSSQPPRTVSKAYQISVIGGVMVWPTSPTPSVVSNSDANAVELGMKFRSSVAGSITGIRFYKGPNNVGTHVGSLWAQNGSKLASVAFTNETSTGWQYQALDSPVTISANTTYIVSYYAPSGRYSVDQGYFSSSGVDNSPLRALSSSESSGNGVYRYGASGFPDQTWNGANYWIDPVFAASGAGDIIPPTIVSTVPTSGAGSVATNSSISVTFSEAMNASTITSSNVFLRDGGGNAVATSIVYDPATRRVTLSPSSQLSNSMSYSATVRGGAGGVSDVAGNTLAANHVWSFTTEGASTPLSLWTNSTVPTLVSDNDPNAVELGMKFRSEVNGYIAGIRFYKGPSNTGVHVGNLWTSAGTNLGSVTFVNETASGWQYQAFASPVPITANTTYVVSYHAPSGFYSADQSYFSTGGFSKSPLYALSNSESGGNGVYRYGPSGFPNQTWSASNYWVDVAFLQQLPSGAAPEAVMQDESELTEESSSALAPPSVSAKESEPSMTLPAAAPQAADAPVYSIWSAGVSPLVTSALDNKAVELGLKFRSSSSGYITGVRFYKGSGNGGVHTGSIWNTSGTRLATTTFSNETSSGWQYQPLATPLAITANTTYVVSYFAPQGRYAADSSYFLLTGVNNGPLRALSTLESGGNGVYRYNNSSAFPNQSFLAANYWVDVTFTESLPTPGDTTAPTVASTSPVTNAVNVAPQSNVTVTFSESMNPSSVSTSTLMLKDSANVVVPAVVSYNSSNRTATLTPNSTLSFSSTYTVTVKGGGGGVSDEAGNVLASNYIWSFSTSGASPSNVSLWSSAVTPSVVAQSDSQPVELGLKFRSSSNGYIAGVRFYKAANNTGTHVGNLWSASGTKIASATFVNETANGWQYQAFANPVPINANATYIVSYHAPVGNYSADSGYFSLGGYTNAPLYAFSSTESGGNGVYRYGISGFPDQTWNGTNYWVDVVFTQSLPQDTTAPTIVASAPAAGATVGPQTSVVVTFSEPMNAASINNGSFFLRNAAWNIVSATVTYDAASRTATLVPSAALASPGSFTATVKGSAGGVTDVAGNALAVDYSWSFTTQAQNNVALWSDSTTPATATVDDFQPVEVGMKFRSTTSGHVTGIRFYKGTGNTGTHVGNLWTAGGTKIGSVSFTNETASGWQYQAFPSPIPIDANTSYVVSYHAPGGGYSATPGYFNSQGVSHPPLYAPSSSEGGGNGVFRYGASGFPNESWNGTNYWVDVTFVSVPSNDTTPPAVVYTSPSRGSCGVPQNASVYVRFSEAMNSGSLNSSSYVLQDAAGVNISTSLSYIATTRTAVLKPSSGLIPGRTYSVRIKGGSTGVKDVAGNPLASDLLWSFSTSSDDPHGSGPGGPILIVTHDSNPFTKYYAEILLTEGLNSFKMMNLSDLTAGKLAEHEVVLLGEMPLTTTQVSLLTTWVQNGGNLITFRPDKKLASLLGLTDASSSLSEGYLQIDTAGLPGEGLVGETIQYHGIADRYALNGATMVARLFSNATTQTTHPAVTLRQVGSNGGQAAAFTYDLAKSVVYTRQGNPAWVGQDRDGIAPLRANDLFYGNASNDPKPDWVDLSKVAIPQADEQQRLLANLILLMNADRNLVPRFWYFPHGHKAAIVMTGDDHGQHGTTGQWDHFKALSGNGQSVDDWECICATSYLFPVNGVMSDEQAAQYDSDGFEVGLHLSTNCQNYTADNLHAFLAGQMDQWKARFPSLPLPTTNRTHCIVWSGYTVQPEVEAFHGIRLDTNYYYFPDTWVANRPGLFTGSGMAMRFASESGDIIDAYQACTQMTDESGQSYPFTSDVLLDRALGAQGYYGAFVANMHTDQPNHSGANGILASAQQRGVPVISARQLLQWLDARNASSFRSIQWVNGRQRFSIVANDAAIGLQGMVPVPSGSSVVAITRSGSNVPFASKVIKGVNYATFVATSGDYEVQFLQDQTAPVVTQVTPANGANNVGRSVAVTATFSEGIDPATLTSQTMFLRDGSNNAIAATVTYDSLNRVAQMQPNGILAAGLTYTARLKGGAGGVSDIAGNTLASDVTWSFTTTTDTSAGFWNDSAVPAIASANDTNAVEVGLRFKPLVNGRITGIRFYKGTANAGTHTGKIWSATGSPLASVTFTNETSSGWQYQALATPLNVTAGVTYVVSYKAPVGGYSVTYDSFVGAGYGNSYLYAFADGEGGGGNGLFTYSVDTMPNQAFRASNYWVDVRFVPN